MVNCCVNPACTAEHKLLRIGDVYAIEGRGADAKYVWICSICAASFDVCLDPNGSVLVVPQSNRKHTLRAHSLTKLLLVGRGVRGVPLQQPVPASCNPAMTSGERSEHGHRAHI
jgi:hypothetical protein